MRKDIHRMHAQGFCHRQGLFTACLAAHPKLPCGPPRDPGPRAQQRTSCRAKLQAVYNLAKNRDRSFLANVTGSGFHVNDLPYAKQAQLVQDINDPRLTSERPRLADCRGPRPGSLEGVDREGRPACAKDPPSRDRRMRD